MFNFLFLPALSVSLLFTAVPPAFAAGPDFPAYLFFANKISALLPSSFCGRPVTLIVSDRQTAAQKGYCCCCLFLSVPDFSYLFFIRMYFYSYVFLFLCVFIPKDSVHTLGRYLRGLHSWGTCPSWRMRETEGLPLRGRQARCRSSCIPQKSHRRGSP